MVIKNNYAISATSWLSTINGKGYVKCFYEPESIEELEELCRGFYATGQEYDLIGHTSNTLYMPDYVCERMVSTRRLNYYEIREDTIVCQCGTSVRSLSLAAIKQGIKGFEGLVDLPGTVAAALYGNAGCFGCSISDLLVEATVLTTDGNVHTITPSWFAFANRSSALKRGEKKAVILTATLKRENGNAEKLKAAADANHSRRRAVQPEAKNSLGSIFSDSGKPTTLNRILRVVTKPYALILRLCKNNSKQIEEKRKHLLFTLLGARDIEPYVRTWNWFQWKDECSHALFWKYVRIHKRMFTRSDFEIEIKHNPNFKIP